MQPTGNVEATVTAAFKRAVLQGLILGALAFVGARQQELGWEPAIYAGVAALLGCLLTRGGFEAIVDGSRQASGEVSPADVQPNRSAE